MLLMAPLWTSRSIGPRSSGSRRSSWSWFVVDHRDRRTARSRTSPSGPISTGVNRSSRSWRAMSSIRSRVSFMQISLYRTGGRLAPLEGGRLARPTAWRLAARAESARYTFVWPPGETPVGGRAGRPPSCRYDVAVFLRHRASATAISHSHANQSPYLTYGVFVCLGWNFA